MNSAASKLYRGQYVQGSRQRGGTLLGLILGLVIGLGIAVAVALLITKSSSPFTNKNGNKPSDTAPAQVMDPNKPLYGSKDAVKEANKEVEAKEAKASEAAASPAAAPNAAVAAHAAPAAKPAEAATPGAAAPGVATPGTAASKATDSSDNVVYYLQAGAFRDQADAESARAKLALLGFEAKISERSSDNGSLYRVRIGPFAQVEAMNKMRSKLSENSVDVAIVRTNK